MGANSVTVFDNLGKALVCVQFQVSCLIFGSLNWRTGRKSDVEKLKIDKSV